MFIKQIYTGCLAEAAYYIESNGEAVIIDPLRDTDEYLNIARERNATIKYVFETHFHADFVSGHIDLAKQTGATIVFGPNAKTDYDFYQAKDQEIFKIGDIQFKVLHTPGHTMESTSYLLFDSEGKENAVFTGDTLFIGDVGRPDLAVKSDLSVDDLAGHLYDSLRNKIMTLPDEVVVYPAHGQGSACGKKMSSERSATIGNQKETNYALDTNLTKDEFIKVVTEGLNKPPQYFPMNVAMNMKGYDSLSDVKVKGLMELDPEEFHKKYINSDAIVIDTRSAEDFCAAHIEGAIFIGIDGNFAPWVGELIAESSKAILIVADKGREEEVVTRLARVGYDNSQGCLKGGMDAWIADSRPTESTKSLSPQDLKENWSDWKDITLDVRRPSEYANSHIEGVENISLTNIALGKSNPSGPKYAIHCAGGYRSVIAASILQKNGIKDVTNILGGYDALKEFFPAVELQS